MGMAAVRKMLVTTLPSAASDLVLVVGADLDGDVTHGTHENLQGCRSRSDRLTTPTWQGVYGTYLPPATPAPSRIFVRRGSRG